MKKEIYDKYGNAHVLTFNNGSEEMKSFIPDNLGEDVIIMLLGEGVFIGGFTMLFNKKTVVFEELKIPKVVRRKGIASSTISLLEDEFKKIGIKKITGKISIVDKETAPYFWKNMGYALKEINEGVYIYRIEKQLSQ